MSVNDIIKNKPYLAWYVKDPARLSEESVLEHVLNYGNWDDVQQFIKIKSKGKSPCTKSFILSLSLASDAAKNKITANLTSSEG